ncbi:MAG: HAD-IIA family hydrolase [Actinomycetaceae bacterium]|nr:HAD-IIA family hydrolase [Actinomycetaceae bacterium]
MALLACDVALSAAYDLILSDLDGVAYRGAQSLPHVAEGYATARDNGTRIVFATNNSARTPQTVAEHLNTLGIKATPADVYNSARTGVAQLATLIPAGSKVLPVGSDGVRVALKQGGFEIVTTAAEKPAAVLQGLDPEVTWTQLSQAAMAISAGAIFVATNMDATLPKEEGDYLGNGSMVAAVTNATGVVPYSSGKPEPNMYQLAVRETGGKRPLVIGDRLNTDIAGANRSNYDSLHVLTGVNTMRDIMLAIDIERPTYLGFDMRSLNEPAPAITVNNGSAQVGDALVTLEGTSLYLNGELLTHKSAVSLTLDQYRAVVATVWHAIDQGTPRDDFAWLPEFEGVES